MKLVPLTRYFCSSGNFPLLIFAYWPPAFSQSSAIAKYLKVTPRLGFSISKSKSLFDLKGSVQEELVFSCVAHLGYNCQEMIMKLKVMKL